MASEFKFLTIIPITLNYVGPLYIMFVYITAIKSISTILILLSCSCIRGHDGFLGKGRIK